MNKVTRWVKGLGIVLSTAIVISGNTAFAEGKAATSCDIGARKLTATSFTSKVDGVIAYSSIEPLTMDKILANWTSHQGNAKNSQIVNYKTIIQSPQKVADCVGCNCICWDKTIRLWVDCPCPP